MALTNTIRKAKAARGHIFGALHQFQLHQGFLLVLFRIEYFVDMAALVANPFLADQCTAVFKNIGHGIPGIVQQVFDHGFWSFRGSMQFPLSGNHTCFKMRATWFSMGRVFEIQVKQ